MRSVCFALPQGSESDELEDSCSKPDTHDDIYPDESGSFSKKPGSYRHRRHLSPRNNATKKSKLHHSWSTPDLSLRASPSGPKPTKNVRDAPSMEYELMKYEQYQRILRDIIKADVPVMPKSFFLCPHKHHCLQNAVMKGFFRTFSAAFMFKTSLTFFTQLIAGKVSSLRQLKNKLRAIFVNEDAVQFSLFVGLMSFTYKAILCILRRLRKKDPIHHKSIAGFVAAAWILLDEKSRRKQIALYCFVRAISDALKLYVRHNKVAVIPHANVAVFTASQLFVMHAFIHAPRVLDKKYYRWILDMGNVTHSQLQLTFRSRVNHKLGFRLASEQWQTCDPILHKDVSCMRYQLLGWFYGLARAARIYIPVHFLPMVLFKPKQVLQQPLKFVNRKAHNMLISSLFLTTYQFNLKTTLCVLRNLCGDDYAWHPPVAAVSAGLSLFIENEHRRSEIMLYCLPRALEVIFRLIPEQDGFRMMHDALRSSYCSVFAFQVAMCCWMTVIAIPKGKETSNSINMTVLGVIFGSKH